MIVFIIGLIIGGWVGVAIYACFVKSGDCARCEECEYKNKYLEQHFEAHRKYVEKHQCGQEDMAYELNVAISHISAKVWREIDPNTRHHWMNLIGRKDGILD